MAVAQLVSRVNGPRFCTALEGRENETLGSLRGADTLGSPAVSNKERYLGNFRNYHFSGCALHCFEFVTVSLQKLPENLVIIDLYYTQCRQILCNLHCSLEIEMKRDAQPHT